MELNVNSNGGFECTDTEEIVHSPLKRVITIGLEVLPLQPTPISIALCICSQREDVMAIEA